MKQKCEICDTETDADVEEANAAIKQVEAQGMSAMAICGACAVRVTAAANMADIMGHPFDPEKTAVTFRQMALAEKRGETARTVLIRQIWEVAKRHGVDYTRTPVLEEHSPFDDDVLTYTRATYAGQDVIECEGVIVERL